MEEEAPSWNLLATIGVCLTNWSLVELQMALLFQTILVARDPRKPGALFDTIISFDIRLAVLNRTMQFEDLSDADRALWHRLAARMAKLYKKRHEVAHFTLANDGVSIAPFMTWNAAISGSQKYLQHSQVAERAVKFYELAEAMRWFTNHVTAMHPESPRYPLPAEEEPPLIARLRALEAPTPEGN